MKMPMVRGHPGGIGCRMPIYSVLQWGFSFILGPFIPAEGLFLGLQPALILFLKLNSWCGLRPFRPAAGSLSSTNFLLGGFLFV